MAGMETIQVLWTWNEALKQWDYYAKYLDREMAEKTAKKLPHRTTITPLMLPTEPGE